MMRLQKALWYLVVNERPRHKAGRQSASSQTQTVQMMDRVEAMTNW